MNKKKKLLFALSALVIGSSAQAVDMSELENGLSPGSYHIDKEGVSNKSLVEVNYTAGATSIRYVTFAASAMKTLGTGTYEKDYAAAGCVDDSQDAASGMSLDDTFDLPQGSRIVSASFLGYDVSNTQSFSGVLWAFNEGTGVGVFSASSGSAFDGGYTSVGGFRNDYVTDIDTMYGVRLSGPASNGDLRLCGVRIGYIPEDLVADVIYASNFYR